MDVLLDDVYSTLSGDSELTNLANVSQFRQPEDPSTLTKAEVVFRPADIGDAAGLHGAAYDPEIEVSVWHYGNGNYSVCVRVAQRVSELFVKKLTLSSGAQTRWGSLLGWQQIDQPDPKTVLLRAEFRSRYWSQGKVDALAS